MLINSAVVVGIGVLVFPIVRAEHEISAYGYLVARAVEGVMLAVGVVFVLLLIPLGQAYASSGTGDASGLPALARITQEANTYSYQIAMIALALGSLLFCRILLRAGLVPRFLAVWGLIGYAVFATGAILEILGYGIGVALSVPGGLFEIGLGAFLIVKGFSAGPRRSGDAGLPSLPAGPNMWHGQ